MIDTPTKNLLHSTNESDSEEAIRCIGELEYVERWDDVCRNIRKLFLCPVFIALYNIFMNGLDCVGQRIESLVCLRREHNLSTLMYTHVLDLSISNAYEFYLFLIEITNFFSSKYIYWSSDFRMSIAKSLTITLYIIQMNKSKNIYCHQLIYSYYTQYLSLIVNTFQSKISCRYGTYHIGKIQETRVINNILRLEIRLYLKLFKFEI